MFGHMAGNLEGKTHPFPHLEAQVARSPRSPSQGSLVKGTPKVDGTCSKALAPPHTNRLFVKRKPGDMGTGYLWASRLGGSSIHIYGAP